MNSVVNSTLAAAATVIASNATNQQQQQPPSPLFPPSSPHYYDSSGGDTSSSHEFQHAVECYICPAIGSLSFLFKCLCVVVYMQDIVTRTLGTG